MTTITPSLRGDRPGVPAIGAWAACLGRGLVAPFDFARDMHAQAVRAGLVQRSMLENAEFEHHLETLEQLVLGPFARRR